jgi:hypothetical protein
MHGQMVYIPCRLDRRDARSALIEDADGWPRKVVSPLGRVGGRLVVAARWVREANGRHLAWFADGQRLWVVQGPGPREDFVPFGPTVSASPAPPQTRTTGAGTGLASASSS